MHSAGFFRSLYFLNALIGLSVFLARAADAQVVTAQVTFDVTLPANTPAADMIYVAGDFQNWDPGATPLTRDSATHASGTVTVPQGSIAFKFTRGDWSRGEKALDCSEIPNRTAQITGDTTITATVENWADVCVAVYDTRAEKIHLDNTALGVPKEFYIYTPPGYAQQTGRRYPALYLFRGHETEWINKYQDTTRGGRNVIDVYENLLASGAVGPMILVFPGSSSNDDSVSGMVTNFKSPQLTTAAGVGNGRFEDLLINDEIGYVDSHYRTVATKEGRGVDGFSLGGFMSAKIGAQHPEMFKTVGAFDGTNFYSRITCQNVDMADQTFLDSMFDPVFGNPRDTAYAALNNGPSLVCSSSAAAMQSIHWFVQYGPLTSEPNDANYFRGDHLVQKLTAQGVTNEISPILEGGHHWSTADEHMRQTLPLHWSVLGHATVFPNLRVSSIARESSGVVLRGTGAPNERHTVQATTNLAQQFTFLGTATADAQGNLNFIDDRASENPQRFYRFVYP